MNNKLENVAIVIHTDGIEYILKTDGLIYYIDEFGKSIKLEDEEKEKQIRKYFESPRFDEVI